MGIKMTVLIINGGCLTVNSSANLCHIAYIKGFIEKGYEVTVASLSSRGQIVDESMKLPEGAKYLFFDGSKLYKRINPKSWKKIQTDINNHSNSFRTIAIKHVKRVLFKLYGPFGYAVIWKNNLIKKLKYAEYDIVVSISSPVISHVAAIDAIKKKKIKAKQYIQIWEDPWQMDLYSQGGNPKLLKIEHRILRSADIVFYVSPITASNQRHIFQDCSTKIQWSPLPYYYKDLTKKSFEKHIYGYFGDYFPVARNIIPFYEAAKELNIKVNICGSPDSLLESTDNITIQPRLPLAELKEYENATNVLVFLCNIRGGQIPGKIYQYSASYNKILFILDGTKEEMKTLYEMFSINNRYYFCYNEKNAIKRAIINLENDFDRNVDSSPVERYSPYNIVEEILDKANQDC